MKRLLNVMVYFLAVFQLQAGSPEIKNKFLKMEAITIHDGLSQGMINCIYQDHFGFMWFGTMDGLNRYDGYHFTVYRYDSNDPNSLSGNLVTSILEDSKGRLWVGTGLSGLNLFERESEKFIRFQNDNRPNTISGNSILSIQEDKKGAIWVGTSNGLNKIDISNKFSILKKNKVRVSDKYIITRIILDKADPGKELFINKEETGKDDYFEPSFFIDSKGVIWVSTLYGLYQIRNGQENSIVIQQLETKKFIPDSITSSGSPDHITNYVEDTINGYLYLMRRYNIVTYNQKTGIINIFFCGKINPAVLRTQIFFLNNVIWETSNGKLMLFDINNNIIWQCKAKNSEQENMFNFSNTIYRDRGGILWIGTKGYGLLKYNPTTELFHSTQQASILWMSSTPKNDIIIQSNELLLYKYVDSTNCYEIKPNFFEKVYMAVPQKHPDLAVQNKEGSYFVSISKLVQFNTEKDNIKIFDHAAVFPMYIDNNDDLWFGDGSTFCNLDKRTGTVKTYHYPLKEISMFPYQFLEAIHQDHDGIFWLGTVSGLLRFDVTNKSWKQYKNIPNDYSSLSSDIIFSLCPDLKFPDKFLWIGTNGGGLNCFEKKSGKFITVNDKQGLPNRVVYGILADESGNLWLSSNKGLTRYTPNYIYNNGEPSLNIQSCLFRNFEEEDGLQSNEFNRYAYTKTTDGTLFFGGVNGFNYFHPKDLNYSLSVPNVIITDFKIKNKSVSFNGIESDANNTILQKPVFLTKKIVLPYKENVISFDFAVMDYAASAKNLFQYKLENFDKEWIQSGISHSATYTNLDPGTYSFMVKGSTNNNIWKDNSTSIILEILPPWYMRWWFKTALFLLISGMIYALYRYRLKQAINLLNVRNRIANDLHDEIGSTLSSVYIYSEVAQKFTKDKLPEANNYLKSISVDVGNMIDALSDIVWTVNSKNDRFENIVNKMRATAVELFEARHYELHFVLDEQLNSLKLGMEERKNFYLLYKEVINNLAKYANGKNAWITISYKKPNITLVVRDDGQGFNPDNKTTGNGLITMKKRAADLKGELTIDSVEGQGTTVTLFFPYS